MEIAARRLRYAWFDELSRAHGYTAVAVAHHADDSIETFFINLLRGTGLRGLTGISVQNGRVIRPLMFASRKEILEYAVAHRIPFREDSSNRSTKYLRNKIRLGLIPRIREEFQKQYRTPVPDTPQLGKIPPRLQPAKASSGVIVEGLDGCLVKFARCCNPVPGDDIVGFITRGFGVSIHKKDCTNVVNADLSSDRWVRTEWASTVKETFKSTIDIIGSDRQGLLADVSVTLSNMRVPIHTFMARETKDNHSHIQVTIGISDLEQLRSIMSSLRKISGVVSVQRSNQPTV